MFGFPLLLLLNQRQLLVFPYLLVLQQRITKKREFEDIEKKLKELQGSLNQT